MPAVGAAAPGASHTGSSVVAADRYRSWADAVALVAGVVFALAGATVFTGWAADVPWMRQLGGSRPILPLSSVSFTLLGVALVLRRNERGPAVGRLIGAACAAVALAVGGASLFERLTDVDLGVDTLLFPEMLVRFGRLPFGRPALNTAACVTFGALAALLLRSRGRAARAGPWLATAGLVIAGVAVVGHLYGAEALYALDRITGMSVAGSLLLVIVNGGLLAAAAEHAPASLLVGPHLGAQVARRLLPWVVGVPLALGWASIALREDGLVSREGGVSFFVVAVICVIATLVLVSSSALRDTDEARAVALAREAAARAEAEQASRAKSDFLAVMSHELRTPLNAIIGYESLLADGITGPVNAAQRQQLGRIKSSATHLVGLIDEILTLARVEAGHERVRPERVDVAHALEDAAAMATPQAAARGIGFAVGVLAEPASLETDASKLRQVLLNLLSNAIKFTERGEVTLWAEVDAGAVRFLVRDTGVGIAPEHLERVFEEFWQVEQPTTRRATGTGLGLAVSRRLARLLGGDLTVQSERGVGSVFVLELPSVAPASAAESAPE